MLNSYLLETAFWLETSLLRMPSTWSRVCSAVSLFYTVRILSTELTAMLPLTFFSLYYCIVAITVGALNRNVGDLLLPDLVQSPSWL